MVGIHFSFISILLRIGTELCIWLHLIVENARLWKHYTHIHFVPIVIVGTNCNNYTSNAQKPLLLSLEVTFFFISNATYRVRLNKSEVESTKSDDEAGKRAVKTSHREKRIWVKIVVLQWVEKKHTHISRYSGANGIDFLAFDCDSIDLIWCVASYDLNETLHTEYTLQTLSSVK